MLQDLPLQIWTFLLILMTPTPAPLAVLMTPALALPAALMTLMILSLNLHFIFPLVEDHMLSLFNPTL